MLLLSEFLDDNAHKCYPFAEINEVPTELIVDAKFMVTGNIGKNNLFINKLEFTNTHILIYMAAILGNSNTITELGRILTAPISTSLNTEYSCKLVNSELEVIIEGCITIGDVDVIPANKNIIYLDTDGRLFQGCVLPVTEWCTGIKINDKIYTGIVTLNAEEGLEFKEDENGNIVLTYTGFNRPPDLTIDTLNDDAIIEKVFERWGTPVTSISGIRPDDNGNINLETGDDTIRLQMQGNTIVIEDNYNSICGVMEDDLDRMLLNIQSLNERAMTLESVTRQLETQTNILSHEVSKIQG